VYTIEGEDGTTTVVAATGFDHDVTTLWGEYVISDDGEIKGSGLSATAVGKVKDYVNVVVRYDSWDPDTETDDDACTVLRAGVTHDFTRTISAGAMYETTTLEAAPDDPLKGVFVRMQAGF
jgi:hypothetical protein